MVFFNYATMQMAAKIVYYGPGLCGKTTNLHVIYSRTAPGSRGEMVSLETETDRTLFFDLLPIDVGVIGGFKTRLQLYTVPGQVFYNTTRKLVLKGVDGIVFVADSQVPMLEANRESLRNLRENLAEIGLKLDDIPLVIQYNKRDLANILPVDHLQEALNPAQVLEWFEASAKNNVGVFETLKGISRLTLRSLKSRMSGEMKRPAGLAAARPPSPSRPPVSEPAAAVAMLAAVPPPPFSSLSDAVPLPPEVSAHVEVPFEPHPPSDDDPFSDTAAAPRTEDDLVRHVRVRSSVDILSELDKLRKLATQAPASVSDIARPAAPHAPRSAPRPPALTIDDILGVGAATRRDLSRSFELTVPRLVLSRSRHLKVTLRFEASADGRTLPEEREVSLELPGGKDLQKLLLALKFHVQAD